MTSTFSAILWVWWIKDTITSSQSKSSLSLNAVVEAKLCHPDWRMRRCFILTHLSKAKWHTCIVPRQQVQAFTCPTTWNNYIARRITRQWLLAIVKSHLIFRESDILFPTGHNFPALCMMKLYHSVPVITQLEDILFVPRKQSEYLKAYTLSLYRTPHIIVNSNGWNIGSEQRWRLFVFKKRKK